MFARAASAATTNLVTPQEIVSQTLAHSHQLRSLQYETRAIEARGDQARAQGLPQLSTDARFARYEGLEDGQFGPRMTIPAVESRYGAGLTVSQPAYTGGRLKSLRELATHQKKATEQERHSAEADLALDALNTYWTWSKAYFMMESLQAAVERMAAHAKDMQNLHDAGLATDNESLSTEVQLDRTRLRLEESRRRVQLATARLAYLTGHPLLEKQQPQPAQASGDATLPGETELLETARRQRHEPEAHTWEIRAAETQIDVQRAENRPQVSMIARYEMSRPNQMNIPPQDKWQDDAYVGISVTWNLFDWGLTKAKVAEAAARAEQARLRAQQTEDAITYEVRQARIQLQDAWQRLVVAERAEKSARRNLEVASDLWRSGLSRHSDVLDAHAQLTDTQYEIIAARADVELARAAVDHAAGRLNTTLR
ncbi:MAG: TolC family protein [Verrucomicrobiota bacterium]